MKLRTFSKESPFGLNGEEGIYVIYGVTNRLLQARIVGGYGERIGFVLITPRHIPNNIA